MTSKELSALEVSRHWGRIGNRAGWCNRMTWALKLLEIRGYRVTGSWKSQFRQLTVFYILLWRVGGRQSLSEAAAELLRDLMIYPFSVANIQRFAESGTRPYLHARWSKTTLRHWFEEEWQETRILEANATQGKKERRLEWIANFIETTSGPVTAPCIQEALRDCGNQVVSQPTIRRDLDALRKASRKELKKRHRS